MTLGLHISFMDDEQKTASDWRATVLCLVHVAILFAPIAIALGVLVGLSTSQERFAGKPDPIVTSTIRQR
ncbi:hypothetical protein D3Y55_09300 [Mesorhizobium sp. DCY119]|nr:hypothetical protein D3Y55_09300 [Mesorhizobium sp. DCY119]